MEPCEEANEDESGVPSESGAGRVADEEQGLMAQDTNKDNKLVSLPLVYVISFIIHALCQTRLRVPPFVSRGQYRFIFSL